MTIIGIQFIVDGEDDNDEKSIADIVEDVKPFKKVTIGNHEDDYNPNIKDDEFIIKEDNNINDENDIDGIDVIDEIVTAGYDDNEVIIEGANIEENDVLLQAEGDTLR